MPGCAPPAAGTEGSSSRSGADLSPLPLANLPTSCASASRVPGAVVPDANHHPVNDGCDDVPRMREGAGNADEDFAMATVPQFTVPRSIEHKWLLIARDWPFRSYLELGALLSAVPCARAHARRLLWEWGLTRLSDNVELVVSELMTNALRASESMEPPWIFPIKLWLLSDHADVLVMVWDANPRVPVPKRASDGAVNGRGLVVVASFSQRLGWYPSPETGGKVVWCLVSSAGPQSN